MNRRVRRIAADPCGNAALVEDRRKHPRYRLDVPARIASVAEQRLPAAVAVDISMGGVLLAFDEPLGFVVGHRLMISLDVGETRFHAIGAVNRVERGTDFRTYLAIAFSDLHPDDFEAVLEHLESRRYSVDSAGDEAAASPTAPIDERPVDA